MVASQEEMKMRKIIIGAILAAVSSGAMADTQIDVMKADRDVRYSIEKLLTVAGDKEPVLRSYQMADQFTKGITPQIVYILNNNDTPCEVIAANVASMARNNFTPIMVNKLAKNAAEDVIGKMAVFTMAKCYELKA